ncbi:type II toxin-antitoxin system RelE/ParE family toxin [Candidatus Berkiella cookevillensis]|uniref:Type II toxin-antitoxin system RelE/ParE family toxin n=1 Tax=Candidatus Berkiella cookevillensis TaxID=437022 RepID=A0A0Q9YMK0_9GAMM|nr:type II toxin-antitoxin system RelE/ParE family toxin [Candidatus Berkiella cookevillensis]MCS5707731.1 type II toxin-antitoxin system RelE/ParE family toxin [Candidatus Berkiella cookevillensis]
MIKKAKKIVEYTAYDGEQFTIEWYYNKQLNSDALDYFEDLDQAEQIEVLKLFKRMGDSGEIKNKTKFRNEGDKIYAFKPSQDRFLCFFFDGGKIIVTNAFRKKQNKLPKTEKEKAENRRKDYIERMSKGDYYDE